MVYLAFGYEAISNAADRASLMQGIATQHNVKLGVYGLKGHLVR